MRVPLVLELKGNSLDDGPGIRTEIFFKGCNMHCPWCSNPETIDPRNQIAFYPAKCLTKDKCGYCVKVCPKENIRMIDGKPQFGTDCLQCLACLQYCPQEAIALGKVTQKREHYHNPNVTADDLVKPVFHID